LLLPDLVDFNDYNVWELYLEKLYFYFTIDFIDYENQLLFQNKPVRLCRTEKEQGKEITFWHIIQKGIDEEERFPNFRRCERIRWIRPIIEFGSNKKEVLIWKTFKKGNKRICFYLHQEKYCLVLVAGRKEFQLLTAYYVEYSHEDTKLRKEHEKNTKKPPW